MPPQDVTNTQTPVTPPVAPQTPPVAPVPSTPSPAFAMDSLMKDKKFMGTVKTFAIYGAIVSAANAAIGVVLSAFHFSGSYSSINVVALVMAFIMGAIAGAIGGALFFFFYGPIHNWVKANAFLSRYIHDMFSLFWKPFLVGTVLSAASGLLAILGTSASIIALTAGYGAVSTGSLFIGWIIAFAAHVAIYYFYSKAVSSKLSPLYPW